MKISNKDSIGQKHEIKLLIVVLQVNRVPQFFFKNQFSSHIKWDKRRVKHTYSYNFSDRISGGFKILISKIIPKGF